MGKALVIKGLKVESPLTSVTFFDPETFLSPYLTANTSINETEKSALKTFFNGLFDNNLLSKMRYVYPMLGDNVTDMLVEAMSPATEDLFANLPSLSGLSVTNRVLHATIAFNTVVGSFANTPRFVLTDWRNMGVITATYHNTFNDSAPFNMQGQNGNNRMRFDNLSAAFTYRPPRLLAGYSGSALSYIPASQDQDERSYLERVLLAQWKGDACSIYKENALYASGVSYADNMTVLSSYQLLCGKDVSNKFFALCDNMSASEWATFHGLLISFLRSVGKHA